MEMFRKWDTFLGPRLSKLVSEVMAYTTKQSSVSSTPTDGVTRYMHTYKDCTSIIVVYGSTTVLATLLLPSIKSYKDLLDSVTNKTNNRSVSCAQVCLLQPDEPGD